MNNDDLEGLEGEAYIDKLFEGVPDPDDECYQVNFPIKDKREFSPTPSNLKSHFLHRASPLIDDYIDAALGESILKSTNDHARFEVWKLLVEIMKQADNKAPVLNMKGKNIDDQISLILEDVFAGNSTVAEGRDMISMVQQGFDALAMPRLMEKMDKLTALGVM